MNNKLFRLAILFLYVLTTNAVAANYVSSVNAYQEGKNIVITYQLSKQTDIKVSVSTDGGKNFSTLKKVIGDVGKDIKKGDKNITWRVLEEFEKFDYDNVCFKVEEFFTENGHEYVDLGLPSGTLWATCNVGATKPEEYGDYFAWGETLPKDKYNDLTYKWTNTHNGLAKYCTDTELYYSKIDYKTTLDLADDVANVNWGDNWRIPTKTELQELIDYCTWTIISKNGIKGQIAIGPNGNSIFFPYAGYYIDLDLSVGFIGFYWSSTLYTKGSFSAYIIAISNKLECNKFYRGYGLPVRPVMSRKSGKSYRSK